ncbi:MAG: apolipoprotein N-acyltransferase [Desulfovibrio sp.]|nr:apolipoprotein N-acyltransferase [Desulfovibrio sp.]
MKCLFPFKIEQIKHDVLEKRAYATIDAHRILWYTIIVLSMWLGFPNDVLHLPFMVLLWPLGLTFLGQSAANRLSALREGWLCSLSGGICTLYWLSLPIHNVGGLPWLPSMACALVISACITASGGIFSLGAYVLRRQSAWMQAVLLGLLWYLLEEVGAHILGFPWLTISGALAAWPLLVQAVDVLGAYALSALWIMSIILCAFGVRCGQRNPTCLAVGFLLALSILAYGWWQLVAQDTHMDSEGTQEIDVLFVEGNVEQNQKWVPTFQRQTVDLYLSLTEQALSAYPLKKPLILWPETAMPFFFEENHLHTPRIRAMVARHGTLLLLGTPAKTTQNTHEEPHIYNRAVLLGRNGATVAHYDKVHLVPFGEYLPEFLNWKILKALMQGVGIYSEGSSGAPLRYDNLALGVLICYEGIFPWLAQERVSEGANILVDISNDGWFEDTPAARQHLYLTTLRALEQNRWILRGTNTGISAIVDTRGRLLLRSKQFKAQALWGRAATVNKHSLYHSCASWLPLCAAFLMAVLLLKAWYATRRLSSTSTSTS